MRDNDSTGTLIKLALMLAAAACLVLFIGSLFNSGRIVLFGIPVSGLAFGILIRELWRKFDE